MRGLRNDRAGEMSARSRKSAGGRARKSREEEGSHLTIQSSFWCKPRDESAAWDDKAVRQISHQAQRQCHRHNERSHDVVKKRKVGQGCTRPTGVQGQGFLAASYVRAFWQRRGTSIFSSAMSCVVPCSSYES
eukprot:1549486-Rhodomonas_salina.2